MNVGRPGLSFGRNCRPLAALRAGRSAALYGAAICCVVFAALAAARRLATEAVAKAVPPATSAPRAPTTSGPKEDG